MPRLILSLFILTSCISGFSQTNDLKLQLQAGESYQTHMFVTNGMVQEVWDKKVNLSYGTHLEINLKVEQVLENGNAVLSQEMQSIVVKAREGSHELVLSSENPQAAYYEPLKKITTMDLSFEVSPIGELSNFNGYSELQNLIQNTQQAKAILGNIPDPTMWQNFFNYLPSAPIEKGKSYQKMLYPAGSKTMWVTVDETNDEETSLRFNQDYETNTDEPIEHYGMPFKSHLKGRRSGDMQINNVDGMPRSYRMMNEMDTHLESDTDKNQQKITMNMKTMILVEVTIEKD